MSSHSVFTEVLTQSLKREKLSRCSVKKSKRHTTGSVGAVVTQQYLILNVIDEEGRALEVVTPWQGNVQWFHVILIV